MNIKKNQHYVPKCYLKNFANDKKLFVLDKGSKELKIFPSNIDKIAHSNYFYDIPECFLPEEYKDKRKSQFIENDLETRENRFSEFIQLIISSLLKIEEQNIESAILLDSDAKRNFSAFLTLQYKRTKSQRELINKTLQSIRDMAEKIAEFPDDFNDIDLPEPINSIGSFPVDIIIREDVKKDSIYYHNLVVSNTLDTAPNSDLTRIFSSHIWLFGINSTSTPLWTSDNPIVIQPYEDFGTGLASRGVRILYPISPKYILTMFESTFWQNLKTYDCMTASLSEKEIFLFNQLQLNQCHRQVYSTENNFR